MRKTTEQVHQLLEKADYYFTLADDCYAAGDKVHGDEYHDVGMSLATEAEDLS